MSEVGNTLNRTTEEQRWLPISVDQHLPSFAHSVLGQLPEASWQDIKLELQRQTTSISRPDPAIKLSPWKAAEDGERLFMLQFSPDSIRPAIAACRKTRSLF